MDPIIPDESFFLDDLLASEPVGAVATAGRQGATSAVQCEDTALVADFDASDWLASIADDPEILLEPTADAIGISAIPGAEAPARQPIAMTLPLPSTVLNRPFTQPAAIPTNDASAVKTIIARQGFRVGNLKLMVPFDSASELSEMLPIYRLPNCAAWFRGLINLHGNLIPVFDLALLFGIKRIEQARPMLLVLNRLEPAAVIVDGMPERLRFAPHQRVDLPALPRHLNEGATAAYANQNDIWIDVDAGRIFAAASQKLAA